MDRMQSCNFNTEPNQNSNSLSIASFTEEHYNINSYFTHRHGGARVAHCIGNSCDNLVGLSDAYNESEATPHPTVNTVIPNNFVQKPARSEAALYDGESYAASNDTRLHQSSYMVAAHFETADVDAFQPNEYYNILSRKSTYQPALSLLGIGLATDDSIALY